MPCFEGCCKFFSGTKSYIEEPQQRPLTKNNWTEIAKRAFQASQQIESYKATVSYKITLKKTSNSITEYQVTPIMGVGMISSSFSQPSYRNEYVPYNSPISPLITKVKNALGQYAIKGFDDEEFTAPQSINSSSNTTRQVFEYIINANDLTKPTNQWREGINEISLDVNQHPNESKIHENFLMFVEKTLIPIIRDAIEHESKGVIPVDEDPFASKNSSSEFLDMPQSPSQLQLTNLSERA